MNLTPEEGQTLTLADVEAAAARIRAENPGLLESAEQAGRDLAGGLQARSTHETPVAGPHRWHFDDGNWTRRHGRPAPWPAHVSPTTGPADDPTEFNDAAENWVVTMKHSNPEYRAWADRYPGTMDGEPWPLWLLAPVALDGGATGYRKVRTFAEARGAWWRTTDRPSITEIDEVFRDAARTATAAQVERLTREITPAGQRTAGPTTAAMARAMDALGAGETVAAPDVAGEIQRLWTENDRRLQGHFGRSEAERRQAWRFAEANLPGLDRGTLESLLRGTSDYEFLTLVYRWVRYDTRQRIDAARDLCRQRGISAPSGATLRGVWRQWPRADGGTDPCEEDTALGLQSWPVGEPVGEAQLRIAAPLLINALLEGRPDQEVREILARWVRYNPSGFYRPVARQLRARGMRSFTDLELARVWLDHPMASVMVVPTAVQAEFAIRREMDALVQAENEAVPDPRVHHLSRPLGQEPDIRRRWITRERNMGRPNEEITHEAVWNGTEWVYDRVVSRRVLDGAPF